MIDQDALEEEIVEAAHADTKWRNWENIAAEIAMRHIKSARSEALEEAAQKCQRLAAMNPRPSRQAAAHVLADAIRALA